jgi:hypothetical protein
MNSQLSTYGPQKSQNVATSTINDRMENYLLKHVLERKILDLVIV